MKQPRVRAKQLDTNEWICGTLLATEGGNVIVSGEAYLYDGNYGFEFWDYVDTDTICPSTGLHDMDGVEIYEGDVIEINYKHEALGEGYGIIPDQDCFCKGEVFYNDDELAWCIRIREAEEPVKRSIDECGTNEWQLATFSLERDDIEVLGNIFDNKDLIE